MWSSTGCAAGWDITYWSLSAWAKHKVKNAVSVIGRFEEALTLAARDAGVDGVICGPYPFMPTCTTAWVFATSDTGDWVESCTAVVETFEGALELVLCRPRRRSRGSRGACASPRAGRRFVKPSQKPRRPGVARQ